MKNQQILLIVGSVLLVGYLLRQQAKAALDAVGNIGSSIGDFLDPVNRQTLDQLTDDINCNHFDRNTERGRSLYERCIAGEL